MKNTITLTTAKNAVINAILENKTCTAGLIKEIYGDELYPFDFNPAEKTPEEVNHYLVNEVLSDEVGKEIFIQEAAKLGFGSLYRYTPANFTAKHIAYKKLEENAVFAYSDDCCPIEELALAAGLIEQGAIARYIDFAQVMKNHGVYICDSVYNKQV